MIESPQDNQILSVGQITGAIKRLLESSFNGIWIRGEISNIRYQSSGHIYFSLKDERAQISAVMFKGDAMKLQQRLKDGMQIIAYGNISLYEPRGSYQMIIRHCIEEGAGRLQAEFERLKKLLSDEGLFDSERKKPIPDLPKRIAVITSPTGAALRDFLSILTRRNWKGEVTVFPAIVQGNEGAPDILNKLKWVEEIGHLDLLILCRGGGSIEDLWNFNEEAVVRAVAACTIPTVSAIGHEIDYVLTDFAADRRAETPSAAAEQILEKWDLLKNRLQNHCDRLNQLTRRFLERTKEKIALEQSRLRACSPKNLIENRYIKLDETAERFESILLRSMQRKDSSLRLFEQRLRAIQPKTRIESLKKNLSEFESRLSKESQHQLKNRNLVLQSLEKRLDSVSADRILERGYAIVINENGAVIKDVKKLKENQLVETKLHSGSFKSQVKNNPQLDLF